MPESRLARTRQAYEREDHTVWFDMVRYEFICHCGARADGLMFEEKDIPHRYGKDYRSGQ